MWNIFKDNVVNVVFILFISYYLLSCSYYMYQNPNFKCGFAVILFIIVYYFIYTLLKKIQKKDERKLKILIVFISFFIYFVWELFNNTPTVSDYNVLWNAAKDVAKGSFSSQAFDITNYFYWWNHQIGYAIFLGGIVKIIGHNLLLMKIIEFLILSFSNLLFYNLSKKFFSKEIALLSTIIYSTYLFNVGGSGIINNQHMAVFFILISFNFFFKSDKFYNKIFSAIFLGLAYIVRPTVIVFFIALILFLLWKWLKSLNFSNFKSTFCQILILIISFWGVVYSFDLALIKTKTIPDSFLSAHCPYYKFILGIQWQNMHGEGTYNDLVYYNWDYDIYNTDAKNYLISKYKNRFTLDILPFWYEKMIRFSAYPDSQIDFAGTTEKDIVAGMFKYFGYSQYILSLLLIFAFVILSVKNKDNKYNLDLFKIAFVGFFLAHLFIEVQPRYRFEQYFIIALFAGPALQALYNYLLKFKNKNVY